MPRTAAAPHAAPAGSLMVAALGACSRASAFLKDLIKNISVTAVDENWIVVCMSKVGVSLSAGDDGGQRSGPVPTEASLAPVEEVLGTSTDMKVRT